MGRRVTMINLAVACDNTSSKFRSSRPAKPVRPAMPLMLFDAIGVSQPHPRST